ncbi:MAG: Rrf2 family transcriptional regulator [Kiritimatiellia bacterium]
MSGIISVSEAASIAFHTAFYLATNSKQLVRNQEMADELHVSQEHLAKIIQRMARAGVIKTVRGPKGGCCLTEKGKAASLLQIYEAVEGPYQQLGCLLQQQICRDKCLLLGGLLQKMSREVYQQLKKTTLADVAIAAKKSYKEVK